MTHPTKSPEAVATAPEAKNSKHKSIVALIQRGLFATFSAQMVLGDLLALVLAWTVVILVGVFG